MRLGAMRSPLRGLCSEQGVNGLDGEDSGPYEAQSRGSVGLAI